MIESIKNYLAANNWQIPFANEFMLIILALTAFIFFSNNPLKHPRKYQIRNFLNWFPMGLTYAFLYMARYNLTVSKNALSDLMSKESFGIIFFVGAWVYALSFLINGPLVDKIGGRKGILIGAGGAAFSNIMMGVLTYLVVAKGLSVNITVWFSILYGLNMYFQSYGAVSIVKVNAPWFHVKERGIFSGIFGTLISLGLYFAYDWGQSIVNATSITNTKTLGFFESIIHNALNVGTSPVSQTWHVFFIPAYILIAFVVIEYFLLRNNPSEAGFTDFDTEDASSGEMHVKFSAIELIKKMLTNPIILTIAFIEFCSGVLRNGIMNWYFIYTNEIAKTLGAGGSTLFFKNNWGFLNAVAGISSAYLAGYISDKIFQSRRGPSAAFMYGAMVISIIIMALVISSAPLALGITVVTILLCVIGVHGLLSGTATMDFGGRKGAATAVGIIDGFVYLGTGVQSIGLGYLVTKSWNYWPIFLLPFAIIGFILCLRIWKSMPNAVRKGKPAH
jgi:OPA family glycerol-3-phosphate transporter-like MFS transporter